MYESIMTEINAIEAQYTTEQVVSRQRVEDHGEVYTSEKEVVAMIDLVDQEVVRHEATVLEPACGNGNFLAEVVKRKLKKIADEYRGSQIEFERYGIIAMGCVYGIDILPDNVANCKQRLFDIFEKFYIALFGKKIKDACLQSVKYILNRNIVWGDALTFTKGGDESLPIVFSEWKPVKGMIKRRDFCFKGLLDHAEVTELPLFSDLGKEVYLPTPIREYPLTSYLKVSNVNE